MKKWILIVLLLISLPLSGCYGIYSNFREIEQLQVMETMGFDANETGFLVSMASGVQSGESNSIVRLCGEGSTIHSAIEQAGSRSFSNALFCYQTGYLLIGEETAKENLAPILSYVCQSPVLRTDLPVFLLSDATAQDVIFSSGDSRHGITEIMQGVMDSARSQVGGRIFRVSDLVRGQERHGCALAFVLSFSDAQQLPDQDSDNKPAKTLSVSGLGIVNNNKLIRILPMEEALGLCFLLNQVGTHSVTVTDPNQRPVVLEISEGSTTMLPQWREDGSLKGLHISVQAKASLSEFTDRGNWNREEYADAVTAALEETLVQQISQTLRLSSRLRTDFASLGNRLEQSAPLLYRHLEMPFDQLLPKLEFRVSVSSQLIHPNDLKESIS